MFDVKFSVILKMVVMFPRAAGIPLRAVDFHNLSLGLKFNTVIDTHIVHGVIIDFLSFTS